MRSHNVRFENDNGESLAGVLDVPDSPPVTYALFAHCFTCSKNLKAVPHVSRALTDAGIAVLRFDLPFDRVVGIDNAEQLFVSARHPKSFVSLDDVDHLLTREEDSLYVGRVLAAWASRHLPGLRGGKPS